MISSQKNICVLEKEEWNLIDVYIHVAETRCVENIFCLDAPHYEVFPCSALEIFSEDPSKL